MFQGLRYLADTGIRREFSACENPRVHHKNILNVQLYYSEHMNMRPLYKEWDIHLACWVLHCNWVHMAMIRQGLCSEIELHHEEFVIASCNKIQLDHIPCHFKNGMEKSAIYRCASKVIFSFAQLVLRSQWVHYTAFSWNYKCTSVFHIQNWIGCVFKYTFFFFFHFSVISGSLFPLQVLFIALQLFPCSHNSV